MNSTGPRCASASGEGFTSSIYDIAWSHQPRRLCYASSVPDLAALMQAVVDAPTEDVPRAAYARAVAAIDPERAELIDIQLELARADRAHTGPPPGMSNRQVVLLRAHGV